MNLLILWHDINFLCFTANDGKQIQTIRVQDEWE